MRNIRHDRVSNTLHIFSNTFNSSATNYLVYDVQSQSIRLPDQEFYLTATDVSFDEQFIYASGKFDQLPTENTVLLLSRRLKPWMIALIVLLSLLVVGIIAWLFIRLRRQRQEKESKKLYYPDEISGSQLSIDNEISTWTLPHNNFNSQPMIAENLLLHDTRVPLTVLATESSSIYSISDMISQELHDDTHNDHDDNTQATLASHTSHASHSHNSHNSNEVISDEQKVMTNTSSYISYASQGSQEAPQISPVSETSSLSECLMVVPNNNPTIAQTTTESSGLTETAFTASEGTLSTVALNRALTDENSDELKDKHTNDESNMTQFKVGQLLRVNTDWGQMKGDLRVKSGDVVRVLEHSDLEWVYGELVNSDEEEKPEGILPANICSISHQ